MLCGDKKLMYQSHQYDVSDIICYNVACSVAGDGGLAGCVSISTAQSDVVD